MTAEVLKEAQKLEKEIIAYCNKLKTNKTLKAIQAKARKKK